MKNLCVIPIRIFLLRIYYQADVFLHHKRRVLYRAKRPMGRQLTSVRHRGASLLEQDVWFVRHVQQQPERRLDNEGKRGRDERVILWEFLEGGRRV